MTSPPRSQQQQINKISPSATISDLPDDPKVIAFSRSGNLLLVGILGSPQMRFYTVHPNSPSLSSSFSTAPSYSFSSCKTTRISIGASSSSSSGFQSIDFHPINEERALLVTKKGVLTMDVLVKKEEEEEKTLISTTSLDVAPKSCVTFSQDDAQCARFVVVSSPEPSSSSSSSSSASFSVVILRSGFIEIRDQDALSLMKQVKCHGPTQGFLSFCSFTTTRKTCILLSGPSFASPSSSSSVSSPIRSTNYQLVEETAKALDVDYIMLNSPLLLSTFTNQHETSYAYQVKSGPAGGDFDKLVSDSLTSSSTKGLSADQKTFESCFAKKQKLLIVPNTALLGVLMLFRVEEEEKEKEQQEQEEEEEKERKEETLDSLKTITQLYGVAQQNGALVRDHHVSSSSSSSSQNLQCFVSVDVDAKCDFLVAGSSLETLNKICIWKLPPSCPASSYSSSTSNKVPFLNLVLNVLVEIRNGCNPVRSIRFSPPSASTSAASGDYSSKVFIACCGAGSGIKDKPVMRVFETQDLVYQCRRPCLLLREKKNSANRCFGIFVVAILVSRYLC